MDGIVEQMRDLVAANRILAREGVVDAFGHISMRHPDNPERYFLSRSRAPELITADDIMEFTLDGEAIDRFEALQRIVRGSVGDPLTFAILRDGAEIELDLIPHMVEVTDRFGNLQHYGQIGGGRNGVEFVVHDPLIASGEAVRAGRPRRW